MDNNDYIIIKLNCKECEKPIKECEIAAIYPIGKDGCSRLVDEVDAVKYYNLVNEEFPFNRNNIEIYKKAIDATEKIYNSKLLKKIGKDGSIIGDL